MIKSSQILSVSNGETKVESNHSSGVQNPPQVNETDIREIQQKLLSTWPTVLEEILKDEDLKELFDTSDYLRKILEYNVPFGKQQRACMFIHMCLYLDKNMTPEQIEDLYQAAWALEILQTSALIYDDIMDDSTTRRGKLCWHMKPEVGKAAVNDAIFLENVVYRLLMLNKEKDEDKDKKIYIQTVEFVHSIILKSTYGQSLDARLPLSGSILNFTLDKYKKIVQFKTTVYTFYGPIGIAMIRNKVFTPENMKLVENITTLIGEFFQVQDDYLDCFGDPEVTGKIGTDIQDGKCSWLIVKALELSSQNQKNMLVELYGQKDSKSVQKVKDTYNDLDLRGHYADYEDETYKVIIRMIQNLPNEIPKAPFNMIMKSMYKRKK